MNTPTIIDINCDLGEGSTIEDCENDAKLMPFISSCNIACGGHAGNELTIKESLINAQKHQLKIGAHPGYADKENFGRKSLLIPINDLIENIKQQLNTFIEISKGLNAKINHIKFHGALYNDIENNIEMAESFTQYIAKNFPQLIVYGLADGNLQKICHEHDLLFFAEGFMDRTYLSNGKLTPRNQANSMIENIDETIEQTLALIHNTSFKTSDGVKINKQVQTICLHGDNPNAQTIAKQLYQRLNQFGISIQ